MSDPDFEQVWAWDGPPRLAVERAEVSHNGRSWQQHRFVSGDGRPGVVIIPAAGDRIALIRIWRPAVDELRLELPRGYGEGDVPAEDARRELLEETGLATTTVESIGSFDVDTGIMPTPIRAFVATVAEPLATGADTDGEADEIVWVGRADLAGLLADGAIRDAITLAALSLWSLADRDPSVGPPVGD